MPTSSADRLTLMKPLISVAALLLAGGAIAQTPDRELARCAAITEPAARLACLDPLVAAAVARLQPAAQAAAQVKAQEQAFGAPAPKPAPVAAVAAAAPAAAADSISSEIEGFVEGWRANQQFRLKNGQVWRISDGSSGDVGLRNPKIRIKRNLFGTYFLEFEGRNDSPKVRRVE